MATALGVVLPFHHFGIASGHDFEFHMNSWLEVLNQWKHGTLYPRWAPLAHYGYGEARFLFYPPFSWTLGAIIGAFVPWKMAPAAFIWVALTLSGCSMFVLARQFLDRGHAVFAAALYAANPYYLLIVYWRSAFAELLAGALLPVFLLYVLRSDEKNERPTVILTLIVAAAWLTNAPSAVMVNYSLALLAVVAAILHRSARPLVVAIIAIVLGLGLAAFYVFPAAYEQKWVNIEQVLSPGLQPQDNFLFTAIADREHTIFNRLVSMIALGEILVTAGAALFLWFRRNAKRELLWPLTVWSSGAILLMLSITSFFWTHLPQLRFVQLPWRWLLCLNVGFALMIPMAWRRWWVRVLACFALLAVVSYGWQRIQRPWWDTPLDIAEMLDNQQTGKGYDGTDEYVPIDVDAYDIDPTARKATYIGDGQAQIRIEQWQAESRQVAAAVTAPGQLKLRLFNYPAWRVTVNGQTVHALTRPNTGEVLVPMAAGINEIRVQFIRTWDRTAGGTVSLITLLSLLAWVFVTRRSLLSPSVTSVLNKNS